MSNTNDSNDNLCENCGEVIPPQRGRPPKYCVPCREHIKRNGAPSDSGTKKVAVPILEPLTVKDKIKQGDIVFRLHPLFKDQISQRRWAPDYRVLEVIGDTEIKVIRNKKAGYRILPFTADREKFYRKTGNDSVVAD